jgi:hypothetical protein
MTRRAAAAGLFAATAGASAAMAGPSLNDMLQQLKTPQKPGTPPPAPPPRPTIPPGRQGLVARGYSERFQPVRRLVAEGRYDEAVEDFRPLPKAAGTGEKATLAPARTATLAPARVVGQPVSTAPQPPPPQASAPPSTGPIVSDAFLANAEMGLLEFEGGHPDLAVTDLKAAEDSLTLKASKTGLSSFGAKAKQLAGQAAEKLSGREGSMTDYHPLDHEAVLQLNYLALAYLLQGERSCYNVTRRCIDQQDELKAKFDKELAAAKTKYQQQTSDGASVSDADRSSINGLANQFEAYDAQATRVPNAYVNPLGDYLAGVIQEIVSAEQPSLRDNSRISYETAAKLCGRSPQLSAAAQAMARARVPAGERVLHVVVGEGFAPTREVLTYGLALKGTVIPVRIPVFTPVPSAVDRVEVNLAGGARLESLDPVGDFEAIRLRDQKDRAPMTMVDVVLTMVTSYVAAQQANRMGGAAQWLNNYREQTASPDTRSWLGLPRRFHVARVVLPPKAEAVEIFAYDAGGRRIGSQSVPVQAGLPQSIVYARATNEGVRAQAARKLWIDGRLEEKA